MGEQGWREGERLNVPGGEAPSAICQHRTTSYMFRSRRRDDSSKQDGFLIELFERARACAACTVNSHLRPHPSSAACGAYEDVAAQPDEISARRALRQACEVEGFIARDRGVEAYIGDRRRKEGES